MWQKLAADINTEFNVTVNGLQVETRYRCVMKRTKKVIDNNNKSGAVRLETEYDEEVQQIIQADDSIFPDFALSSHNQVNKTSILSVSQSSTSTPCDQPSTSSSHFTPSSCDEDSASMETFANRKKTKASTQELLMKQFMEKKTEHFEKRKELYEEKVKAAATWKEIKEENKNKRHAEKELAKKERYEKKMELKNKRHKEKLNLIENLLNKKK